MGNFFGYVYPGLFLVLYGLYQALVVSKAVIFNDSLLYPSWPPKNKGRWARLWKISFGGWAKIMTGILLITYNSTTEEGFRLLSRELPPRFMYPKEWQRVTMFTLLSLSGCADVISKNVLPQRCTVLEKGAQALSIYELLLLLVSHVKDLSGVKLQLHSLLILVVFLLMVVLTAEMWAPAMFHLRLIETFLHLMMGSWLVQAGFILYRPISGYPWDDDDISDIMFVTTFFCWHVIINALCLLVIYSLSSFWHHCYSPRLKLMGSKEAPYHESTPEPLYRVLQEVEQPEKDDQAPLLSKSSH
ncbi:transmembrane epididymal protein 1 [Fukomys damarensis]|uniref:Transmembrane epididymal protein 1 n=1 Tax=Fukomys damarensis TaxID=885580 RepID=A0A091DF23_FUKDA|nr:transmembrane epididymal protein 1 [Fukomys damarensis]KFO30699.1 Transmembrane epididymal protein 1 [Fukomys damarensis]